MRTLISTTRAIFTSLVILTTTALAQSYPTRPIARAGPESAAM
jgi:hypothetical protein